MTEDHWDIVAVVRRRLHAQGDWNINDWKDAARILADEVEKLREEAGSDRKWEEVRK